MTLRGRLTVAFLVIVLGPILISAVAVAMVVSSLAHDQEKENLSDGEHAIRTTVTALCQRARTAAESIAVAVGETGLARAQYIVDRAVTRSVSDVTRLEGPTGQLLAKSGGAPTALVWSNCFETFSQPQGLIAAGVTLRDSFDRDIGTSRAGFVVDSVLVQRLVKISGLELVVTTPSGQIGKITSEHTRRSVLEPGEGQPLQITLATPRADLRSLYVTLVFVVLAACLLAILAAHWLARTLTKPLAELAHAAEQVSVGDFSTRVPVRGRDEISRLARTFNRMLHDLQSYVGALTASRDQMRGHLTRLGQALSGSRDLDGILAVTLETAMAVTGAQAGIVVLRGEESGLLIGRCARGLPTEIDLSSVRIALGEGVLGRVAQTGMPSRGRITPGSSELTAAEPPCRTYIAVPFAAAGRIGPPMGVLALYDRLAGGDRVDDFDDADVVTLQSFAGQAAVAVEDSPPTTTSLRA